MTIYELNEQEKKILNTIATSKDPAKAMTIALNIITAFLTTGEKEKVNKMVAEYKAGKTC